MLRSSIQQEDLTLGFDDDQLPNASTSAPLSFDINKPVYDSAARIQTYGSTDSMTAFMRLQLFANRLLYTKTYAVIYLSCLLMNLILLIYGASHFAALRSSGIRGGDVPAWYAVLDVLATLVLVVEVLIRIAASTRQFFKSWLNLADLLVLVFSFVALFLYSVDPGVILAENLILISRYTAQLFRTYLILKNHLERNARLRAMDNEIDFSMFNNQDSGNVIDEKLAFMDDLEDDDEFSPQVRVTNVALKRNP